MMVSHKHRFCYLRPPRTASGSISKELSQLYEAQEVLGDYPQQTVWKPEFDGYFVFIVVKNPFSRMVSLWKWLTCPDAQLPDELQKILQPGEQMPFKEFVHHPELEEALYLRRCYAYQLPAKYVDRVVRWENLHAEMNTLPFSREDITLEYSERALTYQRPWQEEYDKETLQRVRELWADDFQAYDYSMTMETT